MKIEIVEEDELKTSFILSGASIAFANSFRRAMRSLVPTMAVDYVDFYLNTSFLYDEMLAHRIGLIPIKTDLERFNMPSECVCGGEGCPSCQVSFRLNVEGPKVVYSGDFASDDPEIKPVFDNIPVVELYKGQQLMIEAVARLGVGREHAKFQPVSVCAYRIIPEVRINEGCTNCKECIESCPKKILAESEGKIKVVNANVCSMCMECVKVCIENAISIKETDSFLFTVEGVGSLPIRTVMKKALELLAKKAEEMSKILEAIVV